MEKKCCFILILVAALIAFAGVTVGILYGVGVIKKSDFTGG